MFRQVTLAAALSLLPGLARSSTGVLTWRQSWVSGPGQAVAPASMAARELADGSTMIVGPPAIRYDHDGNLLSTANFSPPFFSSITLPPPNIFQASVVAIDPFGGVFVASASDLTLSSSDIWLMKYDGLTGKAAWSQPLIFDGPTHQKDLPQLLFLDSAGDAVVVGSSRSGLDTVAMKVEGTTGKLLWGPTILAVASSPRASLDPAGNLLLALSRGISGFTDLYKFGGQTGAVVWGPIQFAGSNGDAVTSLTAGPDGSVFIAGKHFDGIELFKYSGVTGSVVWGPVFYIEDIYTAPQATDILVGAGGDVIVSGISSDHFLILKYGGAAGNLLWGPLITQPKYTSIPLTVRLAGNGDLVVSAWDQDSTLSTWRYGGTTGSLLWGPQTVTGAASFDNRRPLTLICSNGRVLTAFSGLSGLSTLERDPATGTPVWGPIPFTITVPDTVRVTDVTQDLDGNVLVTGYGPLTTFVTAKCARSNGAVLWVAVSPDQGGYPRTVRTDASGNVFVLGVNGVVLKYSGTTGSLIWRKEPGVNLSGWRLAIDAAGDVMASEQLVKVTSTFEYDFVTFKLSGATGATLWGPVVFDRGPGTADWPTAIAITPGGDVVVAGVSQKTDFSSAAWVTIKYSGATGSLIWGPSLLDSLPLNGDSVEDLAIDAAGDIVVVGTTNNDTSSPITIIKYSGTTGAVLWGPLKTPQDGSATAVALNTNGDVFVAGYAYNSPRADFATIKYRGSDGGILWGPQFFDGSAGDNDFAYALGLDSAGNPVVVGTTRNAAHNKDIAIVKYDGVTGTPLWEPVIAGGLGKDDLLLHDMVVRGKSVVIAGTIGDFLAEAYDEVFGIQTLPDEVPPAYCGQPFAKTLAAGNATGTITWSVPSGALPPGLALDALSGEISGTPASVGSFAFRVRAQDSSGLVERDFVIDVFEGSAFVPIMASPGAVCLGQSTILSVSGSWTSYHWLPGGETSPTVSVSPGETTDYGVLLTDAAGCSARGYGRVSVAPHSVAIQAPPCVSIGGSGYQASVPDAGPGATYTWMIDNGTITAGAGTSAITFSAGGATPVRLSVAVMDSGGCFSTGGATLGICESKFYTVAPCRLADTRGAPGPSGGPALAANTVRTFPVTGLCGIPSSATAVALNLAVFVPSNDGDLRVYPAGGSAPLASSINFRPGIVRANNAIVPLGAGGQLSVQCDMPSGSTNFFFDVYGYFQ